MRRTLILFASLFSIFMVSTAGMYAQDSRTEYGKCGYYADALHGRKTASGERYDKTLLTCAHKTLPFGTLLKVTRMDNGKSVQVRVNDRGPYIDGYVVDLSRKAAEAIGLIRDGVTKVKVEIVSAAGTISAKSAPSTTSTPSQYSTTSTKVLPEAYETGPPAKSAQVHSAEQAKAELVKPKTVAPGIQPVMHSLSTPPQTNPKPIAEESNNQVSELFQIQLAEVRGAGYGLQLAALTTTESLFQQLAKLQASWPGKVILSHEEANGFATYKLILGPYATRKEALAQQRNATKNGYKSSFVVEFQ